MEQRDVCIRKKTAFGACGLEAFVMNAYAKNNLGIKRYKGYK